jgi:hypothetical protein
MNYMPQIFSSINIYMKQTMTMAYISKYISNCFSHVHLNISRRQITDYGAFPVYEADVRTWELAIFVRVCDLRAWSLKPEAWTEPRARMFVARLALTLRSIRSLLNLWLASQSSSRLEASAGPGRETRDSRASARRRARLVHASYFKWTSVRHRVWTVPTQFFSFPPGKKGQAGPLYPSLRHDPIHDYGVCFVCFL